MWQGRRATAAKICGHALGAGNVILLVLGQSTTLTLTVAVVLVPFTLALALHLAAFLACSCISLALGDRRERTELLVCAIAGLQPPIEGEKYQEAILAEIRAAPSYQVLAIRTDLMKNAPRTILAAWVHPPRRLRQRARTAAGFSTSALGPRPQPPRPARRGRQAALGQRPGRGGRPQRRWWHRVGRAATISSASGRFGEPGDDQPAHLRAEHVRQRQG